MHAKNIIFIAGASFLSCVIPSEPPDDTPVVSFCSSDTISSYSPIKIAFSPPVEDSGTITFLFSPPFFDYSCVLSAEKDTMQLVPSTPFKGSTRYKLTVSDDSFSFFTFAHEQEPNNNTGTADLLVEKMSGSVSNVNDTDFFLIKDKNARNIYLHSFYSESVFAISDSTGQITPTKIYKAADTLAVPDSFVYPICIRVYSFYRSSGGYYEIGSIKK